MHPHPYQHTTSPSSPLHTHTHTQNGDVDVSEKDVYDFMLTQEEIQDGVDNVNTAVKREIAQAKSEFILLSPLFWEVHRK